MVHGALDALRAEHRVRGSEAPRGDDDLDAKVLGEQRELGLAAPVRGVEDPLGVGGGVVEAVDEQRLAPAIASPAPRAKNDRVAAARRAASAGSGALALVAKPPTMRKATSTHLRSCRA